MAIDYTERAIKLLEGILKDLFLVNSLEENILDFDIAENSIVQLGNNLEEKLFLLKAVIEEAVQSRGLSGQECRKAFNQNAMSVANAVKKILQDIPPVYVVKFSDIPGVEIPCSNLIEARKIAKIFPFDGHVIYKDQIIF